MINKVFRALLQQQSLRKINIHNTFVLKPPLSNKHLFLFSQSSLINTFKNVDVNKNLMHWHWVQATLPNNLSIQIQLFLNKISNPLPEDSHNSFFYKLKAELQKNSCRILLESINRKFQNQSYTYQTITLEEKQKQFKIEFLDPFVKIMVNQIKQKADECFKCLPKQNLWEIRKIIQRQYLWNLKNKFKQKIKQNSISESYIHQNQIWLENLVIYYYNQYNPYSKNIIYILGINAQDYRLKKSSSDLTLRQVILDKLKIVKLQMDSLSKKQNSENDYFYQTFKDLFDFTQTPFWEYFLQYEQTRFQQTHQLSNTNKKITFFPTCYSTEVFNNIFNQFFACTIYGKGIKHLTYFIGQKFNGKSHSIVLARILTSFMCYHKMLTISDFQEKEDIQNFVPYLCQIMVRDLWLYLTQQHVQMINTIMKKQNQVKLNQQDQRKLNKGYMLWNPLVQEINNKRFVFKTSVQLDKYIVKNQIKQSINALSQQFNGFLTLLKILEEVKLNNIVIDQFNYFGRRLFQFIRSKDYKFYQDVVRVSLMCSLTSLLYQNCRKETKFNLFASTNDYSAKTLFKIVFNQYFGDQRMLLTVRSYLFADKQATNILHFYFTQQHLKKDLKLKNLQFQFISQYFIKQKWLDEHVTNKIKYGISLRQGQDLTKTIIQKLNKYCESLPKDHIIIQKDQPFLLQKVVTPSIQYIQGKIDIKIRNTILKFIEQNSQNQIQAFQILSTLFCNNQLRIFDSLVYQIFKNKKMYFCFFQVSVPLESSTDKIVPKKMHKGYREYLVNQQNLTELNQIICSYKPTYNMRDQLVFFNFTIAGLEGLRKKNLWSQLQSIILCHRQFFGFNFETLIVNYFVSLNNKQSFQFVFKSLQQNKSMKVKFNGVKFKSDKHKSYQYKEKIVQIQKYFKDPNNNDKLYLLRKQHLSMGHDLQIWFKNLDGNFVAIFVQIKGGQKTEIKPKKLFQHFIGIVQDKNKKVYKKKWIHRKQMLDYLKIKNVQHYFMVLHCKTKKEEIEEIMLPVDANVQMQNQGKMKYQQEELVQDSNSMNLQENIQINQEQLNKRKEFIIDDYQCKVLSMQYNQLFPQMDKDKIIYKYLQDLNKLQVLAKNKIKEANI